MVGGTRWSMVMPKALRSSCSAGHPRATPHNTPKPGALGATAVVRTWVVLIVEMPLKGRR